jgi:hypothetical protein
MNPLVRYTMATVGHSQRYIPPFLLFIAVMAVFTSNDSGPLAPTYAVSAAAVFVCGTWLTMAVLNAADPVQRQITAVNAGGAGRVLVASVGVAVIGCVLLSLLGLVFPLVTGTHPVDTAVLVLGLFAELTGGATAVAVGLLCSRLVIRRSGYAAVVSLFAMFLLAVVPGLPPVNSVFRLLASDSQPARSLLPVALFGLVAVALLVGSTAITGFVSSRRD